MEPSQHQDLVQQGITAAKSGNRSTARSLLLKAVKEHPERSIAWLWLASVVEPGPGKVSCLRRFLELEPEHGQGLTALKKALLEHAVILIRKGEKDQARPMLDELTKSDPDNLQVWLALASVIPDSIEAVPILRRILELQPDNAQAQAALRQVALGLMPTTTPWKCPICQVVAPQARSRCHFCRAILDIQDVEAILSAEEVDEKLVQAFIIRIKNDNDGVLGPDAQKMLALGYLNLKKPEAALRHLELACLLEPDDEELADCYDAVNWYVSPPEPDVPLRGTILVVEHVPHVQQLVTLTLEPQGYQVLLASDSSEALAQLREFKPDLALVDTDLPQTDGYQLCRIIKNDAEVRDVQVVLLSEKDSFLERMRGRMAGAIQSLAKPLAARDLVEVAEKYLRDKVAD